MTHRSNAWHERQLAHARAAMAEADKHHTSEEIAAAERALAVPVRRSIKRGLMHGFHRRLIPPFIVAAAFRLLRLRSL